MFLGAVCEREVLVAPRARGLYVARAVYAGTLLGIIATCWLLVTGTQAIATVGDAARFGGTLMRILGPLQLALAMMSAALASVVAVGVEKDRKTLELLLVSRLDDAQLVLGKLSGSLLRTGLLLLAAVPVFTLATVFGGITPVQIVRLFVVTAAAAAAAASIANAVAFWRDTTFQALAITAFLLVAWLAAGEAAAVAWGQEVAAMVSPARALFSSVSPTGGGTLPPFLGCCAGLVAIATGWAITRARASTTSRNARPYKHWNALCTARQRFGSRYSIGCIASKISKEHSKRSCIMTAVCRASKCINDGKSVGSIS